MKKLFLLTLLSCATIEKPTEIENKTSTLQPVEPTSKPTANLSPPTSTVSSQPTPSTCTLDPYPMLGPEKSKKAACEAASFRYADCDKLKTVATAKPSADFEVIEMVKAPGEAGKNWHFLLLLKNAKGWFARRVGIDGQVWVEEFGYGDMPPTAGFQREYYTPPDSIDSLDVLPMSGQEVVLEYLNPKGGFRKEIPEGHQLDVCGLGASGDLSCTSWLFVTTPSRVATKNISELFSKTGEVYQLYGEELRWCKVSF